MSSLRQFLVSIGYRSRRTRWLSFTTMVEKIVSDLKYWPEARRQFLTRLMQVNSLDDVIALALEFEGPGFYRLKMVQDEYEIKTLTRRVSAAEPQVIVEIGTATGGTLLVWSQCSPRLGLLVSIDLPAGKYGGGYVRQKRKFFKLFGLNRPRYTLRLLQRDSHNPATRATLVKILNNRPIDYLFIDADHTYEGVKKDYELYADLVRPGGLIAFHDICNDVTIEGVNVEKLWQELKQDPRYTSEEIIRDRNQGRFGIGLLTKK